MIVARKVSKLYGEGTRALTDVTFVIRRGEFVFLVGPNGAGKSTLLKLLMRAEPCTGGCILFDCVDIATLRGEALSRHRRRLGTVFQDARLLPKKTVYENVALALEAEGVRGEPMRRRVDEALQRAGLQGKAQAFPDNLSGGQQQQVAIARALVHNPDVILADEPTGNLSPSASQTIMDLLTDINAAGITVIVATHSREAVNAMRRRVLGLEAGRVALDTPHGAYPQAFAAAA